MGEAWRTRIDSIPDIDLVSEFLFYWGLVSPREYADMLDADPDKIAKRAEALKKLKTAYESLRDEVMIGTSKLDRYWDGDGASTYVEEFIPRVEKYLAKLHDTCDAHYEDGSAISGYLQAQQDKLFPLLENYVTTAVWAAGGFTASFVGGPVAAAAGLFAADGTIIAAAWDCYAVVEETAAALNKHELFADLEAASPFNYRSSGLSEQDLNPSCWAMS